MTNFIYNIDSSGYEEHFGFFQSDFRGAIDEGVFVVLSGRTKNNDDVSVFFYSAKGRDGIWFIQVDLLGAPYISRKRNPPLQH